MTSLFLKDTIHIFICDSDAVLFSNKCFDEEDEDEDGSGSDHSLSRSRKICLVKHPTDIFKMPYGSGYGPPLSGSGDRPGDEDSKTSKDDSELEGPIDVESTVTSDKYKNLDNFSSSHFATILDKNEENYNFLHLEFCAPVLLI